MEVFSVIGFKEVSFALNSLIVKIVFNVKGEKSSFKTNREKGKSEFGPDGGPHTISRFGQAKEVAHPIIHGQ